MKILIVDDEALARQRLRRLLEKVRPDAEVFEAENGRIALAQTLQHQPQLLLLDIRMPEMDGLAVAAELAKDPAPPAIVFCTAYDEYALDALKHQAMAYLLKPVRERDLQRALDAAAKVNRAQLDALGLRQRGREEIVCSSHQGVRSLPISDIRCFLAEDKYVRACAPQGELLLSEALKDLEEEYDGRFVRVHRNALVALPFVEGLSRDASGWVVQLAGVDESPQVSRRHVGSVKEALRGNPADN